MNKNYDGLRKTWHVIPNPDPSNLDPACPICGAPQTYAVRHRDGGVIRFYKGRAMTRQQAEALKTELEQSTQE